MAYSPTITSPARAKSTMLKVKAKALAASEPTSSTAPTPEPAPSIDNPPLDMAEKLNEEDKRKYVKGNFMTAGGLRED